MHSFEEIIFDGPEDYQNYSSHCDVYNQEQNQTSQLCEAEDSSHKSGYQGCQNTDSLEELAVLHEMFWVEVHWVMLKVLYQWNCSSAWLFEYLSRSRYRSALRGALTQDLGGIFIWDSTLKIDYKITLGTGRSIV